MYENTADVLLLDDDANIRLILENTLKEYFNVIAFADGLSGVAWLAAGNRSGIIIADLEMPYLDGWELLRMRQVSDTLQDTPLFVLSNSDEESVIHKALTIGADQYIVKPFDPNNVRKLVFEYIPRPQRGGYIHML